MSIRSVLVLYTGGTIGMMPGPRGYTPVTGFFRERLLSMSSFHDPSMRELTTPPSRHGRRVHYDLLEYPRLTDSVNMRREDWVKIAKDIEQRYDEYDGFVVLHGTDTMAYTASALSFMLAGLDKTVVLTGSQIPISRIRNDAADNLLGALLIAGQYDLPEVGIYFNSKLLRGNRAIKRDSSGMDAFRSGNLAPLIDVGVHADVRWDLVRPPTQQTFEVQPIEERSVIALRLFPGITADTMRSVLAPPLQGLVLETYGAGNAPDDRPEFLRVLREATDRGVVIVNVTQCYKGMVATDYAAGRSLLDAGVVPGADMTVEAALTKLQWLLSMGHTVETVRSLVGRDLRGELTASRSHTRFSYLEDA